MRGGLAIFAMVGCLVASAAMFDRIKGLLRRWLTAGKRWAETVRLVPDDDGFQIVTKDEGLVEATVRWRDVRQVRTYKYDAFAHDVICLTFQVGDDRWVEIEEDCEGFDDFEKKMREAFPCIPESWLWDVAIPSFATNEMVLYPSTRPKRVCP